MPRKTSEVGTAYKQIGSFWCWQKHGLRKGRETFREKIRWGTEAASKLDGGNNPAACLWPLPKPFYIESKSSSALSRSKAVPSLGIISKWRWKGEQCHSDGSGVGSQAATQVGCSRLPCVWDSLPEPPPAQVLTLGRPCGGSRRAAKYKVLPWTLKCLATALKHAVMEIREDKEFTICLGCDPAKTT